MLKKTIMTELLTCDNFRANITLACTQYIPVYHARILSDCAIDFIAISCEIIERRSSRAGGGMIIDDYSSLLIDLWIDLSVGVEQNKKICARACPSSTCRLGRTNFFRSAPGLENGGR